MSKLWNNKKYILPKLTEMEQNWITFTRYGLIKYLWQIHSRDSHVEFTEKLKSAIPQEQNYVAWLVKNGKTVFSKLTWKISSSVSGEQADRQASTWPGIFLSRNFRYFPVFKLLFLVKYVVIFVLSKCLMDSEQVILIFTEVWPWYFHVSR